MSVDQTDVVDAIGIDNSSGNVVLTIIDHLPWGLDEHFYLLQEKINTYLSFVESGEMLVTYSDSKGREVLINIVCKYPPDESAVNFLNLVKNIIESAGMKFKYGELS